MLNTHNIKMLGLKRASGETVNYGNTGWHTQISYDTEAGDIYTNDHCGESWSEYPPEVITVCHTTRHMTMQEIADAIYDAVAMRAERG